MALLALILASSLNQAAVAPNSLVFKFYPAAPWGACDAQVDAKFVHTPKPGPTLQTVHVTQGEAAACLQRGPEPNQRRTVSRMQHADPVQPIEQDPQPPAP
jgi:hypothetical protein